VWAGAALAIGIVTFSLPAAGYVRARDKMTGAPLFWLEPRQALEVARPPDGLGVSAADLREAALQAVTAWSFPKIGCTGVDLRLEPGLTDSQFAGRDGKNRIIMRTGLWCHDPDAPTPLLMHCYDPAALAITSMFSRANPGKLDDGQMFEADIEINAVGDYWWTLIPDGPFSARDYDTLYDLASVLTHETGHFIGLEHTCLLPGAAVLQDDKGNETVDCDFLPDADRVAIQEGTMYPRMNAADVNLRTLTADDIRAACEIYPAMENEWSGGGGCAIAPVPSSRGWLEWLCAPALMLALAVFSVRARRRRLDCRSRNPACRARILEDLRTTVACGATPRNDSRTSRVGVRPPMKPAVNARTHSTRRR
jgi:hypothetical protein